MASNRPTSSARRHVAVVTGVVCALGVGVGLPARAAHAQPTDSAMPAADVEGAGWTGGAPSGGATAPRSAPTRDATSPGSGETPAMTAGQEPGVPPPRDFKPLTAVSPAPPSPVTATALSESRLRRPGFSLSLGMGISRDASGLVGPRTESIPAFQAQLGVGVGTLGFEMRLFSNQASGRYTQKGAATTSGAVATDMAVDRLGLDLMMAFRPLWTDEASAAWSRRAVRSLTVNLGVGAENASVGPPSVVRLGALVGLYVDLPLTPADGLTDLRIRLTGRRLFATAGDAGTVHVTDSKVEIFAGLALVF